MKEESKLEKLGGAKKHIVIKIEDIMRYTDHDESEALFDAIDAIEEERANDGKPVNEYLVINTDEPYAHEIIEILKKNGHWG